MQQDPYAPLGQCRHRKGIQLCHNQVVCYKAIQKTHSGDRRRWRYSGKVVQPSRPLSLQQCPQEVCTTRSGRQCQKDAREYAEVPPFVLTNTCNHVADDMKGGFKWSFSSSPYIWYHLRPLIDTINWGKACHRCACICGFDSSKRGQRRVNIGNMYYPSQALPRHIWGSFGKEST